MHKFIITHFLIGFTSLTALKASPVDTISLCQKYIALYEQDFAIPKGLLSAIARLESGRKSSLSKDTVPWPWVINANGTGMFFATKADAVNTVKRLMHQGIRNIDIGCMQINYHHHGEQFTSIAAMFDPQNNVNYGARFLRYLRHKNGSWTRAVGLYHSANPQFQKPYKKKLYDIWQVERLKPDNTVGFIGQYDGDQLLNSRDQSLGKSNWDYGGRAPLFFFAKDKVAEDEGRRGQPFEIHSAVKAPTKKLKSQVVNRETLSPDLRGVENEVTQQSQPLFFNPDINLP